MPVYYSELVVLVEIGEFEFVPSGDFCLPRIHFLIAKNVFKQMSNHKNLLKLTKNNLKGKNEFS